MVSFAGVEDDDINIDELRRVLNVGHRSARKATKDGVKAASKGVGDIDPLYDNILRSIGDRVEKKEVGALEKMQTEMHSLLLLMYKQNQELMKDVAELKAKSARQEREQRRKERSEKDDGASAKSRVAGGFTTKWL